MRVLDDVDTIIFYMGPEMNESVNHIELSVRAIINEDINWISNRD
jgi:hypothetical protein